MFSLAEPTGQFGRWGQAGKALGAFWLLGVISNPIYYELHAPLWFMFIFLGLSIVFALAFGFTDVFKADPQSESKSEDAPTSSASDPTVP
jgi:hypothetical protein